MERADAISRSKSLECSLQMAQDELKRFEDQSEQHKQEIQQLVQSLDEQRSLLSEFESKFRVKTNKIDDDDEHFSSRLGITKSMYRIRK